MPELGRAALVAAFGLILYAGVVGGYAAWRGRRRLHDSAANALYAAFAAVGVAALVLLVALADRDFSFEYVARSTSRCRPIERGGRLRGRDRCSSPRPRRTCTRH